MEFTYFPKFPYGVNTIRKYMIQWYHGIQERGEDFP